MLIGVSVITQGSVVLTSGLVLLGLRGVVQLPFIVSSGHVQPNTQGLQEHIFYFIQLCPDACLQQKNTGVHKGQMDQPAAVIFIVFCSADYISTHLVLGHFVSDDQVPQQVQRLHDSVTKIKDRLVHAAASP